jgi:amino acid adenylation domain-containing protein
MAHLVTGPLDSAPEVDAPLTVVVNGSRAALLLRDTDFTRSAADQYAVHLAGAVAALAKPGRTLVADVSLLDDVDLDRLLRTWNDTDGPVPEPFFPQRIAEVAAEAPDRVAVGWPGGTLTFGQLDDAANRLAHHLRGLGVARQDRVAVCFERGPASLVAQLACFKLAAAVVLLDPSFPEDRLRFMITDAGSVAVLTTSPDAAKVDLGTIPVVRSDRDPWRDSSAEPIDTELDADDLIHVCYTSGSTGLPKAVLVPHGACRTLTHSMAQACGITSDSRGTWLAAPGYGMVQVECFTVLAAGAPVFIPEPSVVTSPVWLRDWLVEERITHTLLMKAMAERLFTLEWPQQTALRNLRICGERVASWPSADLPFHVFNLYGSAEATVVATCDLTALGEELGAAGRAERLPPIGRPTVNVKTYVLDDRLRPVPPGVTGELCVAGESLSIGYLDRPELTAQKWVQNPFDARRYPKLYRTGDLARFHLDGSIEIVGRADNEVKVRGNRVHLSEIEVAISALAGVRQAAVLAGRDEYGDVRLVAYVEPDGAAAPEVAALRSALRQSLPAFMVPTAYLIDHDLPLSTNGKIDRAALPEPMSVKVEGDADYVAPRNETERVLRGMWSQVLEVDAIGVRDNFFDLGGDSLRAARLVVEIRDRFALATPVDDLIDDLFDDPRIERMAEVVGSGAAAAA